MSSLFAVLLLSAPASASAEPIFRRVGLGLGTTFLPFDARTRTIPTRAGADVRLRIDERWAIEPSLGFGYARSAEGDARAHALVADGAVDLRGTLARWGPVNFDGLVGVDVARTSSAATVEDQSSREVALQLAARVGLGVAWWPGQNWSVGLDTREAMVAFTQDTVFVDEARGPVASSLAAGPGPHPQFSLVVHRYF